MVKLLVIACILSFGQVSAQNRRVPVCYEFKDSTTIDITIQLVETVGCIGELLQFFHVRISNDCSYVSLLTNGTEGRKGKYIQRNIIEDLIALEFEVNDNQSSDSMYLLKFLSDTQTKFYAIDRLSMEVLEDFFEKLD